MHEDKNSIERRKTQRVCQSVLLRTDAECPDQDPKNICIACFLYCRVPAHEKPVRLLRF